MRHGAICKRGGGGVAVSVHGSGEQQGATGFGAGESEPGRCDLCQITSQAWSHAEAIPVRLTDFEPGGVLPLDSYVLPHRVVTAHESGVLRVVGRLKPTKVQEVRERVCAVIRGG